MTFRWKGTDIVSDTGFLIRTIDPTHILYVAPRLRLTIPVQLLRAGEIHIRLSDLIAWDEPEAEPLTAYDRERLGRFLSAAYEFAGVKVVFEEADRQ